MDKEFVVHIQKGILLNHKKEHISVSSNEVDEPAAAAKSLLLSSFRRVRLCATPETAAHQAPPSLGFSRQEHWSGWPFLSPMHESEK